MVIFYARSEVDVRGYKMRELEARGRKVRDYYFMWPDAEHLR